MHEGNTTATIMHETDRWHHGNDMIGDRTFTFYLSLALISREQPQP